MPRHASAASAGSNRCGEARLRRSAVRLAALVAADVPGDLRALLTTASPALRERALATLVMYFVVCVGAWLLGDAWRTRSRRRP